MQVAVVAVSTVYPVGLIVHLVWARQAAVMAVQVLTAPTV